MAFINSAATSPAFGLGTSAGYPSAMLLIRRRATAIGLQSPPRSVLGGLAIAGAATVAIGPTIGGLLVGWFNWRAAFAMAMLWIAKDPDKSAGAPYARSSHESIWPG
jgi:MFS family permease